MTDFYTPQHFDRPEGPCAPAKLPVPVPSFGENLARSCGILNMIERHAQIKKGAEEARAVDEGVTKTGANALLYFRGGFQRHN